MAAILGESGLPAAERRALTFADEFERDFIAQGRGRRSIGQTLDGGWRLLDALPREDVARLSERTWLARRATAALAGASP
jgi:V/A-type H+-transporting ATPase subunit B